MSRVAQGVANVEDIDRLLDVVLPFYRVLLRRTGNARNTRR
ncbi:MAG: hypothetical protein U1D30_20180 [Planctomycetota bacterium]